MEAESKIRGFHHSNNNGFAQMQHPSPAMAMRNGSITGNAAGRQYVLRPPAGPTPPQIVHRNMGQQLVGGAGGRRPCYGVNNDENGVQHGRALCVTGGGQPNNTQRQHQTTLLQYQRQMQGSSFMVGASSSYTGSDGNRLPQQRDYSSSSVVRHDNGNSCLQHNQPSFLPVMVDGGRRRKQQRQDDNDEARPSRPTGRYPVAVDGAFVNFQCSSSSASALLPPLPKYRSTGFEAADKARVHRPPRQQQQPQQNGRIPSSTATTTVTDFGRILGENPPPLPASLLNQLHQMAAESANNNGKVEPAGGLGKAKVMVRLAHPRGRHRLHSTSSLHHEQHLRVDQRRRQILLRDPTAMSMTTRTTTDVNARHLQLGETAPAPADGDQENDYADLDAVRDRIGLVAAAPKMFAFDAVFTDDDDDDKGDVAASSLSDVLAAVIRGNDGCVVSFGHPGLGKTEMMTASPNNNTRREGSAGTNKQGNSKSNGSTSLGVIPSAIAWLYAAIAEQRKKTGARFSVRMSAVEIVSTSGGNEGCNNGNNGDDGSGPGEQMRDLLAPFASEAEGSPGMFLSSSSGLASAASLARGGHLFGGQQSEIRASTAEQAGYLLDAALASRISDSSGPRQRQSASSHLLVTLHLYQYAVVPAPLAPGVVGGHQQPKGRPTVSGGRSRLHLLDLSNSPPSSHQHRASSASASGATAVTPSTIGNVLVSIFNGAKHLAQKESKVIQLLRECVGSLTCQASVIASVSSAPEDYRHTLTVTQLAARIHRMRRRKIRMGGSSLAHLGAAHQSRLLARLASSTDPSSSEQSCDTVIYLGPSGGGDDVTDGEHPPNRIINQHRIPSLGVARVPVAVNTASSNDISQQQQHHVLHHHQQRNRGDGHDGGSSFCETPSTTTFIASKEVTAIQPSQLASGPAAIWVPYSSPQGQARRLARSSSTGQFRPNHQQLYPQPVARPQNVEQPFRPPTNNTAIAGATDGRRQLVGHGFGPTSRHQPPWGQVSAVPASRPRQHQAPIDVLENVEKKHHQWEHEKAALRLNQQREKRSSSKTQSKGIMRQQGYGFMDDQKMSMIAQWVQVQTNQLVTTPSTSGAGDGLPAGGDRTAQSINNDDNVTEKTDDLFEEVEEEAQITTEEEEESAAETADGDDEDESLHEQKQQGWSKNDGCENQVIQKPRTKDVAAYFAPGSDDCEIPSFSLDGKGTTISEDVQAQQKTPAAVESRRVSVVSYVEMADSVVQVTEEDIALAMALLNDVARTAAPDSTAENEDEKQPLITREEACSASSLFNTSDHAASSSADEIHHQHDAARTPLSDDQQDSVAEERLRCSAAPAEAKFRTDYYCSDYDDLTMDDDDDDYQERESGVGSDHPLRVLSQENMTVVSTLASDRWSLSSCDTRFNEDGDEIEDEEDGIIGESNVGGLLDVDDCWIPGANQVGNINGRLLLEDDGLQDRDWRRQSTDSDPVLPYFGSLDVVQQQMGPDAEVGGFNNEEIRNYERRHQHRLRMVDELIHQGGLPVSFEDLRKPDGASNPNLSSSSPTAHEREGRTREYFLPGDEPHHASTKVAATGTSVEIMMQRVSRFDSCARKEEEQNSYQHQVRIVENNHLLVEKNSTGAAAFCKNGGERREATEGGCGDGTGRENEDDNQNKPKEAAVVMRVTSNEEIVTCHWSSSGYASSASCSPLSSRESSDEAEQLQHRTGRLTTNLLMTGDRSKTVSVPEKEEACSDDETSRPEIAQHCRDANLVVPAASPPSRLTRMERMSLREQPTNKNRVSGGGAGMRGAGFLLNRSSSFKKAATRGWLSSSPAAVASVDAATVDISKHQQQVQGSTPSPASSDENKTVATKSQNKGCNTSDMEDDLRRDLPQGNPSTQQCSRINEQQPSAKEKEELIICNKLSKNKRGSSAPPPSSSSTHHRHWLNFWPFMSRGPSGGHQHHHHAANPPASLLSLDGSQQQKPFTASSAVEKNGNNKHITAV